jgi:3D (Asp-Asp-Asp) domain-containing protein
MKRAILSTVFGISLASIALGAEQSVLARVTVYWRDEGQCCASWNGARLREGHCAVDPKKIPYGSKVSFPDTTCVAVDTGPAVVSRKAARRSGRTASERNAMVIDRYFETKQQAVAWTKTHPHFMIVRVQTPGHQPEQNTARLEAGDSKEGASNTARLAARDSNEGTLVPNTNATIPIPSSWYSFRHALEPDRLLMPMLLRCARRRT